MPAMKVFNSHTPRPSTASVNQRYQQQQHHSQQQHHHQATVNHHQQQQLQHPVNSSSYFQAPSDHTHIANINDFNHKQQVLSRVPWFDATLALSSLAKGKARGNKSALRLRAKLQEKFFELGCWIQKHPVTVLFVGTLLLVFLSVTLKSATIETNIENLWVEVGGSLEKELNYIKTTTGEGNGNTNQLLIQTPKDESANVLNADALLYHLEVLKAATDVTVDLFDTSWSLRDICLTQPTPKVEEEFIQKILDHLFPCAIISPLDCFWEGSKLLSIKQPIEPPDYIRSVLPEFKWTSLNPQSLISSLKKLLSHEKSESSSSSSASATFHHLEKLEKIMNRAGITTAYQERPCLNPDDAECPSSAPNKASKNLPDIGAYLTGGCNGFATKFMHWPEDLIVGGVKKNSTGHIVKASALQTIIQLMGEKQMYEFWANNNHQVHYIDWSVDKAKQVLETWQREFSREVRKLTGTLGVKVKVDNEKPSLWSWLSTILTSAFTFDSPHTFISADESSTNDQSFSGSSSGKSSSSSSIYRSTQYTISLYTDTLLHDIMISCSSINYFSLIVLLILMTSYVAFVTSNYSNAIYSHTFVGVVGLGLIILSTTAALGTCKHLHVTFNATTTRIVPFIIISFSVYILLLICKTYKDNLNVIMYYEECIIGNLLKQIGPLVCLINTCLILAFLISSIIPIPLLRSFALQCAIILVFNTITLLVLLPAVMTIDVGRRKNNVLDVFCCFSHPIEPMNNFNNLNNTNNSSNINNNNSPLGDLTDDENCNINQQFTNELNDEDACVYNLNYLINRWYIPFVRQKSTKYLTIFVAIVALFSTLSGIGNVKDGLDIKDIVPRDQIEYKFLDIRDKYFSFFNIFAVTKDKFDYPNNQRLLQEYYDSFNQVSKIIKNEDGGLPDFWLNVFRSWLQRLQDAFDADWNSSYITQESWNGNASEEGILAYKLLIQTGRNDNPVDKSLVTKTRLVDSSGIINPKAFYNYLNAWVNTDEMAYAATQAEFKPEIREWHVPSALDLKIPKAQALTYAQMPFFINRVYSTKDITTVIKEIREICAKFEEKGLPNFPTGLPFIYWEQYLRLPMNLLIGGCVIAVAITLVSYIFFFHLTTVMLLMSLQLLLTFQLYALMGILEINMSAITVVILIITIGASTIFFMPITVSFLTSLGHRDSRLAISLEHMLPPTVHGCVSLTLGIGVLAFSELDFIVKYFFYVFAGFIAYGFLYGTIVLPTLLSLIGPESELVSLDLPDRICTPTPPPSPLSPLRSTSPSFDIPYDEFITYRTATGRRQSSGHRNRASNKSAESLRSGKVKTLPSQYFSLREYPPVSSEISLSTIEEESRSNYQSSAEFIVQPPELVVKTTSITNVTSTPNCYHSSSCNEPPKVVIESPVPNSDSEGPESPISRDSPLSDSSSSSGYTCGMSRPNSAPGRVPNVTSSSTSYFLPKQTVTTKVTTTAKVKLYTPSVPPPQNANRSSSSSASSSSSNRNTNPRTSSFSGLNIRNSRRKPF